MTLETFFNELNTPADAADAVAGTLAPLPGCGFHLDLDPVVSLRSTTGYKLGCLRHLFAPPMHRLDRAPTARKPGTAAPLPFPPGGGSGTGNHPSTPSAMRSYPPLFSLLAALSFSLALSPTPQATAQPAVGPNSEPAPEKVSDPRPLEVWTYNIRYASARDGEDHWDRRRDSVLELLAGSGADLVLLQEAEASQVHAVRDALPSLAAVTRGRSDGLLGSEHTTILFCRERFTLMAADSFWHSDTPEEPGSTGWGNRIPRICTWVRLQEAEEGRPPLTVYNLHLDHQSQESRERSMAQVLEHAGAEVARGHRVLVAGDFNAPEDNPVHERLAGHGAEWTNAHRSLHPDDPTGTFNGFDPERIEGAPIDFIYSGPGLVATEAEIVLARTPEGRWPSDHFPVRAVFE